MSLRPRTGSIIGILKRIVDDMLPQPHFGTPEVPRSDGQEDLKLLLVVRTGLERTEVFFLVGRGFMLSGSVKVVRFSVFPARGRDRRIVPGDCDV